MAKQTIDNTAPNADNLPDGADIINDNFDELYLNHIDVVRDHGADPTGVADSATAINAALAAADTGSAPYGAVVFPYGDYRVDSTLAWKANTRVIGIGHNTGHTSRAPRINWNGSTGGTVVLAEEVGTNFRGSWDGLDVRGNSTADILMRFQSRPDLAGGFVTNSAFQDCRANAIVLDHGCTNFRIQGCRWDNVGGFGIAVQDISESGAGATNMSIEHCTIDMGVTGTQGGGQGFLLFDYKDAASGPQSFVKISDCELELNDLLETWESAVGVSDRAVIAIGWNDSAVENPGFMNVYLSLDRVTLSVGSGQGTSTAFIKVADPTDYVCIVMNSVRPGRASQGITHIDAGTTWKGDTDDIWFIPFGVYAPSYEMPGANDQRSYFQALMDFTNGALVLPQADPGLSTEEEGAIYYNPSDNKIYVYDSVSGWIATAALT